MTGAEKESRWEPIIGLEIHVQLKTVSKMFCGCRSEFGAPPNSHVCPVCLGLPGALPVANRRAIELAVRAALALQCAVQQRSEFARKNYFYPDLPKGYQISQYDRPLATGGWLELPGGARSKGFGRVRIRRLHVEEDSGKSLHDRYPGETAVDLNRAGVPLVEIVTEPDIRSAAQARLFLTTLKQVLEYLDVSDCNMEEGSLRVDANVSVRPVGSAALTTKTEVKNMNSFSQLEKALEFEASRHIGILEAGGAVEHETMLWDPARGEARPMRGKEEVHDYRYFAEPDLPALEIPADLIATLSEAMPELPWAKRRRFQERYGLEPYDAEVLSATHELADYYEAVAAAVQDPKAASNWIRVEVLAVANEKSVGVAEMGLEPERLAELIKLVKEGTLSHNLGRQVLRRIVDSGLSAAQVVQAEGLKAVGDSEQLGVWVAEVLRENPAEIERYRNGEEKLLAYFMGLVMRKSRGRADPGLLRAALVAALGESSP